MATGEAIVKKALDQFTSTLTSQDVRMFSNTSLEDLWREARRVEHEQGARGDLKFMRRLEPFLRTLESYAGVIEVFCQGSNQVDVTSRNYSGVMEKILQAFNDIGDALPRLDRLKATFPNDTYFNQVVGFVFSDIIEFHQRAYKFFRRKAWHFWFAFDWGLFERRFKLILEKLASHCDLLDKEAAAAHFFEMKQFRDKRQLEEAAFELQRQNQMARDVFIWLSAAEDQQEDHLQWISDNRQPETCDWILEDPQMRPWIEDDGGDSVLWMTGIPGSGKSFLCSLVVRHLQAKQHLCTLYYFCGHQSSSGNTSGMILRTLAFQLLQQSLDMASLVHQAYLQKGSNRSGSAMKKLLTQLLPSFKVARIVIDGIDESDRTTQQELLKSLAEIQKSADQYCKLLISSRDEPQIQKLLAVKTHLNLRDKTVEGLRLYIKHRIKGLQVELPEIDSSLMDLAEQRLQSKAKGMFLWVRLVTATLVDQISEAGFKLAIDQLPEGLEEAYGLIQSRIDSLRPQLRQQAFNILYWVCAARRPLLLHEVADGIVLHPGQITLNKRTRVINMNRDIIELCAPLLERLQSGVVDLVHFSAKEYFVHQQSGPFIDVAKANLNIALACVINLTSCLDLVPRNTEGMSEGDLESRVVQGCYGLQSYGQDFWDEHVLAYLREVGDQDAGARKLIGALEVFSHVWKHRAKPDISLPSIHHIAEASLGLSRLRPSPTLHRFVSGWLHFKSEFNRAKPSLNTLDAQKQWRLEKDETFLSLIDSRLSIITERLLMMQSSRLPSHIDEDDFGRFVSRFNFPCRFQGCNHQYDTVQERDSHEMSHIICFPCLQCDFSGRGFRSRKDLEKHTQRYHLSPEDFEIPDCLQAVNQCCRGSPNSTPATSRVPFSRSGNWTEHGRRALQQGFHHVLAKLESEIKAVPGDADEPGSTNITSAKAFEPRPAQRTNETTAMMSLESIRHSVKEQTYESLADFKNDLSVLSGNPTKASKLVGDGMTIESICDHEFENAMSAFPAFANFDHKASKKGTIAKISNNVDEQLQGQMEVFNEQENDVASPSAISIGTRVPYWSRPEKEQFPELLQRYGRSFSKIADHLKTKTPEEVDQHFARLVSMGNSEISDSADFADARLQREARSNGPTTVSRDADCEIQAPNDPAHQTLPDLLQPSHLSSAVSYFPQLEDPRTPPLMIRGTSKREMGVESSEIFHGPRSKKRRPPPRVLCTDCPHLWDGLRDEYALKKHRERWHTATRKVWICQDISIDKRFLTNCKSCAISKRYTSKHRAGNHLREVHFNLETSAETLQRWMREIEEPNPRMPKPFAESASTIRPTTRGQETRRANISLPPLRTHRDSSRTLPSIVIQKGSRKSSNSVWSPRSLSSLDGDLDEENDTDVREASLSSPQAESFEHDLFLEDISFENLIPGNVNESRSIDENSPPHRINRAFIKPDQVPRLPNLNSFQKSACLDQVEAIYHKLDNASENSLSYEEALESLTLLSRLLMRNLRDWQRHSTLAPNIPFSI